MGTSERSTDDLGWYRENQPRFAGFARRLAELLADLADARGIKCHAISYRGKSLESFAEKLGRGGKNYRDARREITDLAGVRVVVYDRASLSEVDALVQAELDVDPERSADKALLLSPQEFGYLSCHYVVQLKHGRAALGEWAEFSGLTAEIQVRTVLQHAWASLSHALQYKKSKAIPPTLQRRLYRVAALLELADEEFRHLRNEYERAAEQARVGLEEDSALDVFSLSAFLELSPTLKKLADRRAGAEPRSTDRETAALAELCSVLSINTVGDLDEALTGISSSRPDSSEGSEPRSRAAVVHSHLVEANRQKLEEAMRRVLDETRLRALREVSGIEVRSIPEHVQWTTKAWMRRWAERLGLGASWVE